MSIRQIKKILTVLGGIVGILFISLLVNNYFNIYLFISSLFLNIGNVCIKEKKIVSTSNDNVVRPSPNDFKMPIRIEKGNLQQKRVVKIRVRRKD